MSITNFYSIYNFLFIIQYTIYLLISFLLDLDIRLTDQVPIISQIRIYRNGLLVVGMHS